MLIDEEFLSALRSLHKDKTPELDELTAEFYLRFWPQIGSLFISSIQKFLQKGLLPKSLRVAVICFAHKRNDPGDILHWRPISLLSTDYKIVAKMLSNRLKSHL